MEEHTQTLSRVKRAQDREKVLRYSIRKYGFGAASVAVAALYLFMGRGAVYAAETSTGANAPETTEMAATPEGEGEVPAEVAAAIQSGKEKIAKTTQEKLAALKADKSLSPEKLQELTTDVELSSKTTEGLLDALGGTLNVQQVEELVNQALDAIQNAEKAVDATETGEMEENAPAGGEAGNAQPGTDNSASDDEEESDEEVQNTLNSLKDTINQQKEAAIAEVKASKEGSEQEKEAAIAAINAWAEKTNKELDKAYEAGADSEELTAKSEELVKEFEKAFEGEEETSAPKEDENTDKPTGDMKPEEQPSTPAPKEETPAPVDRTAALKTIEDAKSEQEGKINAREGLSDDEQADALEEIGDEAEKATKAVNEAKTQEDVIAAQNEGVKQIKTVNPVGKEYALDEIDTDLEDKKAEITKDTKLSEEQKKTIVADLEQGAKELKEAIAKLPEYEETDEAAVATEKQIEELVNGFKESLKQAVPEDTKEETPAAVDHTAALKAIEDAKMAQEEAIEADDNLSAEEVSAAKSKIATAVEGAKKAINAATSQETVDAEKEKGLVAVKSVNPVGKDIPIDDLRDAVATKKAEIAKNDKLTSEEKEAANKKIDAGLEKLVKGITTGLPSYVDTPDDVEEMNQTILGLVNQFKKGLDKVGIPADKPKTDTPKPKEDAPAPKEEKPNKEEKPAPVDRTVALKAIEDAKAEQLQKIAENEGISEEEANYANAEVEKEVAKAIKAVNDATTQEDIAKASQDGVEVIHTVNPVGKDLALDEIDDVVANKKADLIKDTKLTEEQKKATVAEIDKAVKEVKAGIAQLPDYGDTDKEVETTEDQILALVNGLKEALKLVVPETPKDEMPKPKEETPAPKENPKLAEFKAAVKAVQEKKLAAIKAADYLGADKQKELEEKLNNLVSLILTSLDETPAEELTDESKAGLVADIEGIEVPAKVEKPKVDTPTTETKPKEEPKTDKPATPSKPEDKPKSDEPAIPSKPEDKPKSDKPATPSKPKDKPKADEPVAPSKPEDKPKTDEPVAPSKPEDKPKSGEPVAPSKPADKPSSETPSEPMKPMDKEQPATPKKRTLDDAATHTHVAGTEASLAGVDHLVVKKVKSSVLEGRDYDAFDIELRDANDKAIQPRGSVRVSLPARKAVEAVYYIDADNKLAVKEFTQADGMVSFDTDHFSVYALVYKAEKDAPSPMATNQDKSEKMEAKKDDKKELPNTGDKTPTVSFLVGLALALMGMLALKHKEN